MHIMKGLVDIINSTCTYESINNLSGVNLRKRVDGINLIDAIYYRFLYAEKNSTKQQIVSKINEANNTVFSRQSYESKENNIPIQFYELLLNKISVYYNVCINPKHEDICIAIDGTYNTNNKHDIMLNMGLFDINNQIPISLDLIGTKNRNNEVHVFMDYLKNNKNQFKSTIFICDRLYFTYEFLYFLESNGYKYIIRAKKNASNLDPANELKKNNPKHETIMKLRQKTRIINCKGTYKKTVCAFKSKKKTNKVTFEAQNDCVMITNLLDTKKYSDDYIIAKYRSRWDIEVYFKLVKANFKFQNMREKDHNKYKKLYLCELIMVFIMKLIEKHITKNHKINKSNILKGIFDSLLNNILHNKLNKNIIDRFIKSYVVFYTNDKNRSFPRISKTPFTKWYIKGYSEMTQFNKIINALKNKTTVKLNKNLKSLAKKIIRINNKPIK